MLQPLAAPAGELRESSQGLPVEGDVLLPLGDSYLWVVLHPPVAPLPKAAVVVCSPFTAEKVKAHRTRVALARLLAGRGLAVARFDHRGTGDSGERPFRCEDDGGQQMRGVLTLPDPAAGDRRVAILLLPAGLLPRYRYHRHHVKGARFFAAAGFTVLRIDLPGLGDAGGELPEGPVEWSWREVQGGAFVPAALAALRALRRETGIERVVVAGACGGAITALLAAVHDPRAVAGCLTVSLPFCLSGSVARVRALNGRGDGSGGDGGQSGAPDPPSRPGPAPDPLPPAPGSRPLHPRRAAQLLRQYLNKLVSPRAWVRLLHGQSDLSLVYQVLRSMARRRVEDIARGKAQAGPAAPDDGRLSPLVFPASRRAIDSSVPLLVVLGEQDPDADDFHRYFEGSLLVRHPELRGAFTLELFAHADHTFAQPEDEQQLWQRTLAWLEKAVPAAQRAVRGSGPPTVLAPPPGRDLPLESR